MEYIRKDIEDFVIIDGEKILKNNAIKTELVSKETLAGRQQSFENYERELKNSVSKSETDIRENLSNHLLFRVM